MVQKEFISRNGEFTVNIALISLKINWLGKIRCNQIPTQNTQYFSDGFSSFKYNENLLKKYFQILQPTKLKFLTSRSHLDFITEKIIKQVLEMQS